MNLYPAAQIAPIVGMSELDIFFHLCPERVNELLLRNNIMLPAENHDELRKVLKIMFNIEIRLMLNVPAMGKSTKVARAIQILREGKLIDQEAV